MDDALVRATASPGTYDRPDGHIQSVDRALRLLNCFSADAPEWQLKDLAAETDLTVQTAHRLLRTLLASGFVNQSKRTKAYTLGPAVVRLAGAFMRRNDLLEAIRPDMEQLRSMSEETVALHWLVNMERLRVAELVSPHPIRMTTGVGQSKPLHRGAAGKAILAFQPEDRVEAYLKSESEMGRVHRSLDAIREDLEHCRRFGYSISLAEDVDGAASIAAPICNRSGLSVASLSVTGPESRWTLEDMRALAPALIAAASGAAAAVD